MERRERLSCYAPEINPIVLSGNWYCGYALDLYSHGSAHLVGGGFDTDYTVLGGLVNKLKYKICPVEEKKYLIRKLGEVVLKFLEGYYTCGEYYIDLNEIDYFVWTPPSIDRSLQPVYGIVAYVSYFSGVPILEGLSKRSTTGVKYMNLNEKREKLSGVFSFDGRESIKNKNLLIIDDTYATGATLSELTKFFYDQCNVEKVFVLTIAKNRTQTPLIKS